jgi:hypothetical protein
MRRRSSRGRGGRGGHRCETIIGASAAGATWAACRAMPLAKAADSIVTPRRAKNPRSFSTARDTRFCAASSDTPIATHHFAQAAALQETHRHGAAVLRRQFRQRFVQRRRQRIGSDVFIEANLVGHGCGLVFVSATAGFQCDGIGGGVARGRNQPRRQTPRRCARSLALRARIMKTACVTSSARWASPRHCRRAAA